MPGSGDHWEPFQNWTTIVFVVVVLFFQYLCYKVHNTLLSFLFQKDNSWSPSFLWLDPDFYPASFSFWISFNISYIACLLQHTQSFSFYTSEGIFISPLFIKVSLFVCFSWVQNSILTVFFFFKYFNVVTSLSFDLHCFQ